MMPLISRLGLVKYFRGIWFTTEYCDFLRKFKVASIILQTPFLRNNLLEALVFRSLNYFFAGFEMIMLVERPPKINHFSKSCLPQILLGHSLIP